MTRKEELYLLMRGTEKKIVIKAKELKKALNNSHINNKANELKQLCNDLTTYLEEDEKLKE